MFAPCRSHNPVCITKSRLLENHSLGCFFSVMDQDTSELFRCIAHDCSYRDEKLRERFVLHATKNCFKVLGGFWHVYSNWNFYVRNHIPWKAKGEISNWDAFVYTYHKNSNSGQEDKLQAELITSKVSSKKNTLTLDTNEQTFNRDNADEHSQTGNRKKIGE